MNTMQPLRAFVLLGGAVLALASVTFGAFPAAAETLQPGVRGVATRAPAGMKIDGNLQEFDHAFATPVGYFEPNVENRAAQFFYMWDDDNFYAGLRTLDKSQHNASPDDKLWEGDGVEWYFDTRRNNDFRATEWGPGAVHMYWTAYNAFDLKPRWCVRPDMVEKIPISGVEVAARKTSYGAEVEFKLPWKNFPDFKPERNAVIALDAELCYDDGKGRCGRTFAYGSPLSVTSPASQAKVQLVDKLDREYWKPCGAVMMPVRCDTAWDQKEKPVVTGLMMVPPNEADQIGKLVFRLVDTEGHVIADVDGKIETLQAEGKFQRARAQWSADLAAPGAYNLVGIAYDKAGKELTRVAPRMVSVASGQGY